MLRVILAILITLAVTCDADARRRWLRRRTYTTYAYVDVWGDATTDQEKCEAEASYMAANFAYYHVGRTIGNFEGFGVGGWGCGTCTPGYGMTLTGDAQIQSSNGQVFRVRSWR